MPRPRCALPSHYYDTPCIKNVTIITQAKRLLMRAETIAPGNRVLRRTSGGRTKDAHIDENVVHAVLTALKTEGCRHVTIKGIAESVPVRAH